MHVNVPNWTSTTLPSSSARVSGAEPSQAVAPARSGIRPFPGHIGCENNGLILRTPPRIQFRPVCRFMALVWEAGCTWLAVHVRGRDGRGRDVGV